jgi:hypothetical protein
LIHLVNHFDCRGSLTQAVEAVNIVLEFNRLLTALSKHPQEDQFARGLGRISLGKTQSLLKSHFIKILHSYLILFFIAWPA